MINIWGLDLRGNVMPIIEYSSSGIMRVTLVVNVIALVENLFLLKGKLPMNCPYCNHPMIPGFVQGIRARHRDAELPFE